MHRSQPRPAPTLYFNKLLEDIKEVLRTLTARERQVAGVDGRYYQMRILPYRTIRNVIDGVVVTFTDVTALKKAELSAANAKTYAEKIVETVREPLLVLDAELRVDSANGSFYDTFQATPADTLNRSLYELGNGQWDIPELRRLMGDLLPQKKAIEDFEVTHHFATVGPKVMLLNARQIDHVALILLAIEDITDRKRAEAEVQRLNEDLKHFSYAASHDLQEPLRMVISFTQLLAKEYQGKLDAKADRYMHTAIEGAARIEALLRHLREFWSVNEQTLAAPAPVDCNRALDLALQLLTTPIRDHAGHITRDQLPVIVAEEVPIVMLLQNLVGNGLKYHRPNEVPRIHVSAERCDEGWKLSVSDNGIGIEPEHVEAIFAPFKRLHGRQVPGSGLGLAICERIVRRFAGRIWVESQYGEGSTFCFTIPVRNG